MRKIESPEACALQLRKLLMVDSSKSGREAADLADSILMDLTARVRPESSEEMMARKLSTDLHDFFLEPRAVTHDEAVRMRNDLTRRVELLHQAVIQSGVQGTYRNHKV